MGIVPLNSKKTKTENTQKKKTETHKYEDIRALFPEKDTITILLATPNWNTGSLEAIVSPFVFIDDLGEVYIENFSILHIHGICSFYFCIPIGVH